MFPSAKVIKTEENDSKDRQSLDWLSLGSFQSELAGQINQQPTGNEDDHDDVGKITDRSSSESPVHEYHKKKKKEKHKHKKKKKKTKVKSPEREIPTVNIIREVLFKGNKVFIEEIPDLESKDAYRIDRKSDINTWNYGSLYKGHVAKYHGNLHDCIGSSFAHKVVMKENKQSKKTDFNRYCSKESRKLCLSIPLQKLLPKGQIRADHTEVISVKDTSVLNKTSDIRERLLDNATSLYIQGKGKESVNDEPDITEENAILYKTIAEFNRKTRENPKDVDLWLEFVDFQDKVVLEDSSNRKVTENNILEKKISIIKKAMEANPACIQLKMKYLDLCKGTMSPDIVSKEMEQLLFIHPTNMLLWQQYLLFHQSCVSKFTVSKVCKVYHDCFNKLHGYMDGKLHTHTINKNLHREVLDVFVQYCYFLKQAGQIEKAVASFQAQIEYNLFCPSAVTGMYKESMYLFESFWDSGVARSGESGAKGWSYWYTNKVVVPELQATENKNLDAIEQDIVKKEQLKWKIWKEIEIERQSAHWLPWRPDLSKNETEEDCEDLDRLVLFDDINSILMVFPSSLHFQLVTSFLQFLNVGVESQTVLPPCSIDNLQRIINNTEIILVQDYMAKSDMKQEIIKCFLDQMIDKFDGENKTTFILHKMYFHFQLCQNESKKINRFKKFVKGMLKEEHCRSNLCVWGAYCDILCKCGCHSEAIAVIETALSLVTDNTQKHSKIKLYRMLTELYLGISSGEKEATLPCDLGKAQHVLVCFIEDTKYEKSAVDISAISVLRSRKKLESLCDNSMENLTTDKVQDLSKSELKYISDTFKLLSLFEYSFGKHEIELASAVLEDAVNHLQEFLKVDEIEENIDEKIKNVMEDLFDFSIILSKHHMAVNITPLSTLRQIVQHAMKIFPGNPYFLQVFIDIELKMYISGRLDRYFSHTIRSVDSPIPVIFAVYSILCRQSAIDKQLYTGEVTVSSAGGLINRIRSYLERALGNTSVSQCPLLWRLYLHSEVQFGNLTRAKGIFYRALQSCPWSKALYLDAVSLFTKDKIEEIVDLMTEKEIRLQIPLEEVDILMEDATDNN
ncbi:nuclear exosome regulator NRDE2-like [Mytilus californianus]|uniref:nuclear exosome regulator NRDE2-like n=1 Tax=Mytilus californianus TaxID=6549 RepID=UPI002246CD54|nr:nuclear exosome regulator NRDE2-like [Mytilus californianus]